MRLIRCFSFGKVSNSRDDEVRVSLRGGDLLIHFDRESRHLFMTGPAKEVFHGSIDIPEEIYYDLSEK